MCCLAEGRGVEPRCPVLEDGGLAIHGNTIMRPFHSVGTPWRNRISEILIRSQDSGSTRRGIGYYCFSFDDIFVTLHYPYVSLLCPYH
jgi:hypothetical protein